MDVTQGLAQELGMDVLAKGEGTTSSLIDDAVDLQDYKLGQVVFYFIIENTDTTNDIDVEVTVQDDSATNASDNLDSGSELFVLDVDGVGTESYTTETKTVGEFDRYTQISDITENGGGGTPDVTVVVLGGKRES